MKNFIFGIACLITVGLSCSKKPDTSAVAAVDESRATYDTTAIDSFSSGATSVDVMQQIRMSSQRYQDSLKAAIELQKQEKKIADELEKENKKKAEEEKKKSSETKDDKPKTE